MKSCFGSADFWRLRIGLGRPDARLPGEGGQAGSGEGIVDWVLSDFSRDELEILNPALDAAANLLIQTFTSEPQILLKEWAKKKISIANQETETIQEQQT
jgi:PTH1 family peptidyl-tRNA hydrolase